MASHHAGGRGSTRGDSVPARLQRYSFLIGQVLDNTGSFSQTIYVPFTPDEVKVKQIGFYLTGATNGIFHLRCDSLVSGMGRSNLGIFIDPVISFNGITYPVGPSVHGSHTFSVQDSTGANLTVLTGGDLLVHLEFRRYI